MHMSGYVDPGSYHLPMVGLWELEVCVVDVHSVWYLSQFNGHFVWEVLPSIHPDTATMWHSSGNYMELPLGSDIRPVSVSRMIDKVECCMFTGLDTR